MSGSGPHHGAREIKVPQLGEGLREARIVELLCVPGTPLRRGDRLYVIEKLQLYESRLSDLIRHIDKPTLAEAAKSRPKVN